MKQNPLRLEDMQDFIACYHPDNPRQRQETEHFHAFAYNDLVQCDNASLEDTDNLPAPEVLAAEIIESLQATLEQFSRIYEALGE